MTMPTNEEKARARRAGQFFARANRPITSNPYKAMGDERQRELTRWFVRGYTSVNPDIEIDFDD